MKKRWVSVERLLSVIDPHAIGLDIRSWSGHEAHCLCPFHNDSRPSASFNVRTGKFYCFGCGVVSNAKKLATLLGSEIVIANVTKTSESKPLWISLFNYDIAKNNEYLESRMVSNSMAQTFEIRDTPLGVAVPLPYHNKYTGIVVRKNTPKGSRYIVFGNKPPVWPAYSAHSMISNTLVVEGIFGAINAMMHGINAVATLGAAFRKETAEWLGQTTSNFMFDDDKAGAIGMLRYRKALGSTFAWCYLPGYEADEMGEDFWTMYKQNELPKTTNIFDIEDNLRRFLQ